MYRTTRRSFTAMALGVALGHTTISAAAKVLRQPACSLCNDAGWLGVTVEPIPPMHDLFGADYDIDVCPLCLGADSHAALTDVEIDALPNAVAYAVGGWNGPSTRYTGSNGVTVTVPRQWPHDYWGCLRPSN